MFKPLSIYLAMRYVRSRNSNGFSSFISASSTIGIALGVMVLIIVLSAMNGFERALAQQLLSVVPHAELKAVSKPLPQWQQTVENIKLTHKNVIAASPVITLAGMLQKGDKLKAIELRGVDVALETQVSDITNFIDAGQWLSLKQENGIVIGRGIADKLGLELGSRLQVLLPRPQSETFTQKNKNQQFPVPLTKQVHVVAIFSFGGVLDDTLAYMSHQQLGKTLNYQDMETQGIRIKVTDVFQAPLIIRQVGNTFDHYVYMLDWTRTQGHVFNDIQLVRMVMNIVLIIVIAVASFNIVSTLIMAVNERKGDIAILKTMGASRATIMVTFVIQGLVNGVLGSIVGGLSGIYIALNLTEIVTKIEQSLQTKFLSADVYFIDFLPSYLHQPDVVATVAIALLMSLVATLYPAWQATKIQPAQVLGQI